MAALRSLIANGNPSASPAQPSEPAPAAAAQPAVHAQPAALPESVQLQPLPSPGGFPPVSATALVGVGVGSVASAVANAGTIVPDSNAAQFSDGVSAVMHALSVAPVAPDRSEFAASQRFDPRDARSRLAQATQVNAEVSKAFTPVLSPVDLFTPTTMPQFGVSQRFGPGAQLSRHADMIDELDKLDKLNKSFKTAQDLFDYLRDYVSDAKVSHPQLVEPLSRYHKYLVDAVIEWGAPDSAILGYYKSFMTATERRGPCRSAQSKWSRAPAFVRTPPGSLLPRIRVPRRCSCGGGAISDRQRFD